MTGFMKPISTLMKPLRSVDLTTLEDAPAAIERSDVCAVPAAAVVGEAMVGLVLADALLERFGGDTMTDLRRPRRRHRRARARPPDAASFPGAGLTAQLPSRATRGCSVRFFASEIRS